MSYDDPWNYKPLELRVRSFGHVTGAKGERPDIEHRYTEETIPAPPRITHHTYWSEPGRCGVFMLSIRVACAKCLAPQEFCVSESVAPGLFHGRLLGQDYKLFAAQLAGELNDAKKLAAYWRNRFDEIDPHPGRNRWWCLTDELLEGADDL